MVVIVAVAALAGLVAGACGSDEPVGAGGTAPDTTATTAAPVDNSDLPEGFPSQVILVVGDPVADVQQLLVVDVASGEQRVLAERDAVAALVSMPRVELASMSAPALSVDGTEVSFSFGYETWTLLDVPVDGSAPPRVVAGLGRTSLYGPSPDGRWRAAADADGLRLVPADGSASPRPTALYVPYPPAAVAWSPDGAQLAAIPHFERSAPPPPVAYSVSPTGLLRDAEAPAVVGGAAAGFRSGQPWFDADGRLHVVPDGPRRDGADLVVLTSLAVDRTHRFVLGLAVEGPAPVDGVLPAPGQEMSRLVWWDAADEIPDPHPIELGVDLPPPFSTGVLLAAW